MKDGSQMRSEEAAKASAAKYLYYHFDLILRSDWSLVDNEEQDKLQQSLTPKMQLSDKANERKGVKLAA